MHSKPEETQEQSRVEGFEQWIVLGSANGSTNLGDEAMWEAAVQTLRTERGAVHVVTDAVDGWQPPLEGVTVLPNLVYSLRRGDFLPPTWKRITLVNFLTRAISWPRRNAFALSRARRSYAAPRGPLQQLWWDQIAISKGLIVSGAGAINDDYAPHGIAAWSVLIRWAKAQGKPIAIVGQGVGPITDSALRRVSARMLLDANLVTVRERGSKSLLKELGVDESRATVTPDWALAITPSSEDHYRAVSIKNELIGQHPFFALSLHRRHNTSSAELKRLSKVAEDFVLSALDLDHRVLFVANMTLQGYSDDRETARILSSSWSDRARGNFTIQEARLTPRVTRALLSQSEGVISTRYHPMVFAFSEGVPCVGVSYDRYYDQKLAGISGLFGVAENVHRLDSEKLAPKEILRELLSQVVPSIEGGALLAEVRAPLTNFLREFI